MTVTADELDAAQTVYGVVLSTDDNSKYGLRHVVNIWRKTELGFDESETKYDSLMGKTISEITYFTNEGIYTIPCSVKIPVKIKDASVSVANTAVDSAEGAAVTLTGFTGENYPEVNRTYTVTSSDKDLSSYGFNVADGKLKWTGTPPAGVYTLTITDSTGNIAPYSVSFELTTGEIPAEYDGASNSLIPKDGKETEFANYISEIKSVKIGDITYSPSGRNSVKIINADGTVDWEAKSGEQDIFTAGTEYSFEITANGYTEKLTFNATCPEAAAQVNLVQQIALSLINPIPDIKDSDVRADGAAKVPETGVNEQPHIFAGNEDSVNEQNNISEDDNSSQSAEDLKGGVSDTVSGDESYISEQDSVLNDSETGGDEEADYTDSQYEILEH